jgi:hypothetical protein
VAVFDASPVCTPIRTRTCCPAGHAWARIEQAKADAAADQEPAREGAGQAAGRGHGQWRSVKADAAAKMRGLQGRMGRKRGELDAKVAEDDAEGAEGDALDALATPGGRSGRLSWLSLMRSMPRAGTDERAAAPGTG